MRALLGELEAALELRPTPRLALFYDAAASPLPAVTARRWPRMPIVALTADTDRPVFGSRGSLIWVHAPNAAARHAALAAHGPFDVIVDATASTSADQLATLRATFFHVRAGGYYLTRHDPAAGGELAVFLTHAAALRSDPDAAVAGAHRDDVQLGNAFAKVREHAGTLLICNQLKALPKMRYAEMDQVLEIRGPALGLRLTVLPGASFDAQAQVEQSYAHRRSRVPTSYTAPDVALREYHNVICAPHQVLIGAGMLLPDTYRHPQNKRLANRYTTEVAARFARYPKKLSGARDLAGDYFYLGSEHPQHFGHAMTEQLSRLWAWPEAKRRSPEVKALVPLRRNAGGLTSYEASIFTAAGVDRGDILTIEGPVRVERLLAANPMLVNPHYVHPGITELWGRAGDALAALSPEREFPERIFASRRTGQIRRDCGNVSEVEDAFASHGFEIVYPETFSLPEQVAMFRAARVVGGFAGSGLFDLLFCRDPKRVVMISSESYTARNEHLIAAVLGHELYIMWCVPEIAQPTTGWNYDAFQSRFSFDFVRDGAKLHEVLSRDD